jgi:hypothetical protein
MRCDTEPLGTLMRNGPIVPVHDGKDDKMWLPRSFRNSHPLFPFSLLLEDGSCRQAKRRHELDFSQLQLICTGVWGKKYSNKTPFQIEGKGVEAVEKEPIKLLSL